MKNEEALFAALGEIDPALLPVPAPEAGTDREVVKTGLRRVRRWAVIAAAAFLLIGGAAAAAPFLLPSAKLKTEVMPEEERSRGDFISLYDVRVVEHEGSLVLSDAVMADLEALVPQGEESETVSQRIAEGSAIPFDNWSDAAEWLDCGLLVSPLLGDPPNENCSLIASWNDGSHRNVRSVYLFGQHLVEGFDGRVMVSAYIPLNDEAWEIYNAGTAYADHGTDDGPGQPETSGMLTPQGDEVSLVTYKEPGLYRSATGEEQERWRTQVSFTHGGVLYRVETGGADRVETEAVVCAVLDSMG